MMYLVYIAIISFFWVRIKPSNDRNWSPDHEILPYAKMIHNVVQINNIRNFRYHSKDKFEKAYYSKSFDLSEIENIYYIVVPFTYLPGGAHTFLSFEFAGNRHIAVSIEARRRKGARFSVLRSLFKGFELTYVIADENDVIKLRSNHRYDDVFVYPLSLMKGDIQRIFIDILDRANELKEKPEFYNLFTNTCTTNLFDHINNVIPKRIPFHYTRIMPKHSDKYFHKIGLLNTKYPFRETKKMHHISERARKYDSDPDFPIKIRQFPQPEFTEAQ